MAITRRRFLAGMAGTAGALATAGALRGPAGRVLGATGRLPAPQSSGIDHIVVLCMENRSFDHMLGWVPGADGAQGGLQYRDPGGVAHSTYKLSPDWQGCALQDPDHSYDGGRAQLALGACDGFRSAYVDVGGVKQQFDDLPLGYYTADDLPASRALVENFTVCDRWFCSLLGPTYPNRIFTHAAATDRISNGLTPDVLLPTIWDSLQAAKVSCQYYFSDLPVLGLWGQKYYTISSGFETFLAQAASGQLPSYSYVDPFFLGEGQGGSNDDHPHADIRRGQALISLIVNTLMHGPLWSKTVLIITYDEWGGFYDHVRPPRFRDASTHVPNSKDTVTGFEDHAQAGFRVPTYIVSPFSPRGEVSHVVFDHTAIARFVEWRFGLQPLTVRDAASSNIADVLDFSAPNLTPPVVPSVLDPGPHVCGVPATGLPVGSMGASAGAEDTFWHELAASPQLAAFNSRRSG
ncbi:MAG TPA: alkaline phosphatase family protein [Candidatus Dormibacteraeota bacterium]|nr:alkaline phosphatase family protein [Candidatus Dormibacteraeota bacterium]